MAQEWNIRSRGHVCSICTKPLVDKAPVISVLKELPDGYERLDCHPECWKTSPRDWEPFSSWEGVYLAPPPPDAKKEPLKKETADDLLRHLIALEDPAMKNVVYVLAVMLERSKILIERDAREQEDHTILRVYEHRRTGESFVVLDPRLRLENLAEVQQQVVALLSGTSSPPRHSRGRNRPATRSRGSTTGGWGPPWTRPDSNTNAKNWNRPASAAST